MPAAPIVHPPVWLRDLNALTGGCFLLVTFALVSVRQVQACVRLFIGLSVLLGVSALLLAPMYGSWHLVVIGIVDISTKAVIIPLLLRRALPDAVFTRREVTQVLNIPTALLIALGLAIIAFLLARPLLAAPHEIAADVNLPIGLAGVFVGALTAAVRREAVPLLLGLLAMENSAFFAGIGVAPEMPLIAEAAIAFDVLILVLVVSVLTRMVHQEIGTIEVGTLATLREESGQ